MIDNYSHKIHYIENVRVYKLCLHCNKKHE